MEEREMESLPYDGANKRKRNSRNQQPDSQSPTSSEFWLIIVADDVEREVFAWDNTRDFPRGGSSK